jgi:hypothetical protein
MLTVKSQYHQARSRTCFMFVSLLSATTGRNCAYSSINATATTGEVLWEFSDLARKIRQTAFVKNHDS